ncbi:phage tail protein [Pseudomonas gingeri]|uniref:phage tail protein n=2 Tax=Pseudomonas gingeri TaxID=117681 RepID=UPI0015A201FC|nr:tail fiber protein [Pseudomonas gingeri]NWE34618.1 tail fiber protein [Pseudomonas gingeri]NWE59377.1 tail fiber protein [Pseudomonas gingeri]NWF01354.1 tail fiber protein [Pseudomonas gingeri]
MDYPKSVPSVGLVNGKFVDENPVNGSPGSLIPAVWGNAVTEELLNVVQAGGLQPSETARDQLLTAIRTIIQSALPVEQVRTTLAAYGITDAYTKAEIEEKLKNTSALPVGVMVPFPKGTVPPGYLEVDGSVQSAATYPDLYAYLGTTFNNGSEPAGFFRLPESRGEFLRGWDHGRGVDVGRAIGSYQSGQVEAHEHASRTALGAATGTGSYGLVAYANTNVGNPLPTGAVSVFGGNETRPRNWSVMWCIKAWNAPTNQGNIDVAALAAQVQSAQKFAFTGSHKGLTASASGLNSLVSVSADQLVVGNEVSFRNLNAVSLNINTAVVGVNGLDTGALAASTWYSLWVIWNGTATSGLLSLSATSPTLPNGYTHKARVGWIRTDAVAANKFPLRFVQSGRSVRYSLSPGSNMTVPITIASGATGGKDVAVSLVSYAPPTATAVCVAPHTSGVTGSAVFAPGPGYTWTNAPLSASSNGSAAPIPLGVLVLEANTIYYIADGATCFGMIYGWEDGL